MEPNEPVAIRTTTNPAEAEILKGVLQGEGIACDLEGENQGSLAGVLNIRILVRAWDEERARKVLAQHGHHRNVPGMRR